MDETLDSNPIQNITDAIGDGLGEEAKADVFTRGFKFLFNTIISMIWYAGCFAVFMVGSVYFK